MRHDKVGTYLHYSARIALGIETILKWYTRARERANTHAPTQTVIEDVIVLWNHRVHAGRQVTANRPYIIIKNKKD